MTLPDGAKPIKCPRTNDLVISLAAECDIETASDEEKKAWLALCIAKLIKHSGELEIDLADSKKSLPIWRDIGSAPMSESESFMVRMPLPMSKLFVCIQVSRFEGNLYPDHLDGCIDWGDRILTATHWQPLLEAPAK